MDILEDIKRQCLLNRGPPIAFTFAFCHDMNDEDKCHETWDALCLDPDTTTEWFYTILDVLCQKKEKLPDPEVCKKLQVLAEEKDRVPILPVIEKLGKAKTTRCKDCTKLVKDMIAGLDGDSTFEQYVDDLQRIEEFYAQEANEQHAAHRPKDSTLQYKYDLKYNERVKTILGLIEDIMPFSGVVFVAIEYWDTLTAQMTHAVRVFDEACDKVPPAGRKLVLVAHLLNGEDFSTYDDFQPGDDYVNEFIVQSGLK